MGYKMPLVVKDVYLPFDDDDDGITPDEYEKKYGIRLEEIFKYDSDTSVVSITPCKLYIIYTSYSSAQNANICQPVMSLNWDATAGKYIFNGTIQQNTFCIAFNADGVLDECGFYDNN